jgi:RecJ-like exonuclease
MKISKKLFVVVAITFAMVMIAGCPTQTTVNKIQQDPGHFYNKEVALRGTVTETYGALGTGVYQLDDGTGKIWILSENYGVPGKGARVTVTGNVVDTISFAGKSFATALRQTRRRGD